MADKDCTWGTKMTRCGKKCVSYGQLKQAAKGSTGNRGKDGQG